MESHWNKNTKIELAHHKLFGKDPSSFLWRTLYLHSCLLLKIQEEFFRVCVFQIYWIHDDEMQCSSTSTLCTASVLAEQFEYTDQVTLGFSWWIYVRPLVHMSGMMGSCLSWQPFRVHTYKKDIPQIRLPIFGWLPLLQSTTLPEVNPHPSDLIDEW
jgi:hypothetical protein